MKKKKAPTLEVVLWLTIDPELLASTAIDLMKLSPETALSNEDFRPFVAKAFSLLTLTHQFLEEQTAYAANKA